MAEKGNTDNEAGKGKKKADGLMSGVGLYGECLGVMLTLESPTAETCLQGQGKEGERL